MSDQRILRPCGRPTHTTVPCDIQITDMEYACKLHATREDLALSEAYKEGWTAGFESGTDYGRGSPQNTDPSAAIQ